VVTFTVTDNGIPPLNDTEDVTITVNEVNDAPILAPIGSKTVDEEVALQFTVTASDANDVPANALTLSASNLPTGATFTPATGVFAWTPTESQQGQYVVTFTVTDNGIPPLNDTEDVTITVNDVTAPTVTAVSVSDTLISDADAGPGKIFTVTVKFSEDMDTAVNPAILFTPAHQGTLSNPSASWTTGDTFTVTYEVSDQNIEVADIQIDVEGAQNATGKAQADYAPEIEFSIDTGNPVVTVDHLSIDDRTPALSGTVDDPDAAILVTVGGSSYTATNHGNGTWTLADNTITPPLAEGSYDVVATATDTAGNVGVDTSINELTILWFAYYVNDEATTNDIWTTAVGNDANDGRTPATPKATIQAIFDAYDLGAGQIVYVDAGSYAEHVVIGANDSGLTLRGAGPSLTTIDGGGTGRVLVLNGFATGTIQGFTITGGNALTGAGIYVDNSSPIISDNMITGNSGSDSYALIAGTGIYLTNNSHPVISRNVIQNNQARPSLNHGAGAGIYVGTGCDATIVNNVISGNTATGMHSAYQGRGAAVYIAGASPTLVNNTIYGNTGSGGNHGAVQLAGSAQPNLTNNILANNSGYAITEEVTTADASTLQRNLFWSNGRGAYYDADRARGIKSGLQLNTLLAEASGNMLGDPRFVAAGTADFRLAAGSFAVDVGASGGVVPADDLTGAARPAGTRPDVGAYESDAAALDTDGDTVLDGEEQVRGSNPVLSDSDADGTPDANDAFPIWPEETTDSDGDGLGNNFETTYGDLAPAADEDGDGFDNLTEFRWGTDPRSNASQPDLSTLYVDGTAGSDIWGVGSSERPYRTVTKALWSLTAATTRIEVRAGRYSPTGDGFFGEAMPLRMVSGVSLVSESGAATTVLDGGNELRVLEFVNTDSNAALQGFTITGGNALTGAGIYVNNSSPIISDNMITGNSGSDSYALIAGTGIYLTNNSHPVISRNVIQNNQARPSLNHGAGAGIYVGTGCDATIVNNVISDNTATGMHSSYQGRGVAIFVSAAAPLIANNTIANNTGSGTVHGALQLDTSGAPVVVNNIFAFNSGYAIAEMTAAGSPSSVRYNDFWNNATGMYWDQGTTAYADVAVLDATVVECDNNLSVDPLFADPPSRDFHLKSNGGRYDPATATWVVDAVNSPSIDAGDPASPFANEPAPHGGRINQGAYGNTVEASKTDENPPTVIAVTVSAPLVSDADTGVGKTFTVTVDFSEVMDIAVNPTLAFTPSHGNTLTNPVSSWPDSDTFTVTYEVSDENVDVRNLQIGISGARDAAGNVQQAYTSESKFSIDTQNPTVFSLSPANAAVGVTADVDLVITFDEPVQVGAGTIAVRRANDGAAVETIDVTSAAVAVDGATVTIVLANLLASSTDYYVEVSGGAFQDLAGNEFAGISDPSDWNFDTNLVVTSFAPTSTGFRVQFSEELAASVLNLYDQGGVFGAADVIFTGTNSGPVRGSLVLDPDLRSATFIKTAGLLQPGQYSVTLTSAAAAFRDGDGNLLDGDQDGTPGGDFVTTFTIATPEENAVIVSLPNVTRGYGQPVNVPASELTAGLPLSISNGQGVTEVSLEVHYDPALLTVSAFMLDPAVESRATVTQFEISPPGVAVLTITAPTGLADAAGLLILGSFAAVVPDTASYGGKHVLDIDNLQVSTATGTLQAFDDDAIHIAAFLGDANGDGWYNSPDATLTRRIIGVINTGLAAYQMADPGLIVDIDGNGYVQANDTTSIRRAIGLIAVPNIPALPEGLGMPAAAGVDPLVYIPRDLTAAPGDRVTVPVRLEVTERSGITLSGFEVVLEYDPTHLTVTGSQLGGLLDGTDVGGSLTSPAPGRLVYSASALNGTGLLAWGTEGDLFTVTFAIAEDAPAGASVLNLRSRLSAAATAVFDAQLNHLVLSPAPTDLPDDPVDGLLTNRTSRAAWPLHGQPGLRLPVADKVASPARVPVAANTASSEIPTSEMPLAQYPASDAAEPSSLDDLAEELARLRSRSERQAQNEFFDAVFGQWE